MSKKRKSRRRSYKNKDVKFSKAGMKGKVIPYSRLYNVPVQYNQTITKVVINDDAYDTYLEPSAYSFSKVSNVTNALFFEGAADRNLQQCFEEIGQLTVVNDFVQLRKMFRWCRFKWIRITLTPMNYEAAGTNTGDPEHPILHVINDTGTSAIGLGVKANYTIEEAQSLPANAYSQHYFNKPLRFDISPYFRTTTMYNPENKSFGYMPTWTPTNLPGQFTGGTNYIPVDNFYFGFTDLPAGWTFKVKIEACVEARSIKLEDE